MVLCLKARESRSPPGPPNHTDTPTPAGWSSPVARQAHNLKVIGSNPIPATIFNRNDKASAETLGLLTFGEPAKPRIAADIDPMLSTLRMQRCVVYQAEDQFASFSGIFVVQRIDEIGSFVAVDLRQIGMQSWRGRGCRRRSLTPTTTRSRSMANCRPIGCEQLA